MHGLERPPGEIPIPGGRGRRERPLLSQALPHPRRRHQPRPRAHGLLPRHGRRRGAFLEFMDGVPFYGASTACIDNPLLAALLPRVHRRVFTYGTLPAPTTSCACFHPPRHAILLPGGCRRPSARPLLPPRARPPQRAQRHRRRRHRHSARVSSEHIATGLGASAASTAAFRSRACARGVTVIDDYGHHPTEILATLSAARDCGLRARPRHLPAPPLHPHPRPHGRVRHRLRRRRYRPGARHLCRQRRAHPGVERPPWYVPSAEKRSSMPRRSKKR